MRFVLATTLAFSLLAVPSAYAAKRGGVDMPDSQTVAGEKLVLNGLGLREATIFKVDVYVAGLYLKEKTSDPKKIIDPKTPKKILMHFVRDVDKDDIQDAYKEGFEKNGGKALMKKLEKWNAWMSAMKEGQRMAIEHVPGKGTTVLVGGKAKGTIDDDAFAKVMFTIFFGPNPPNSDLKEGMLGKRE